jgi:hypothetical protein
MTPEPATLVATRASFAVAWLPPGEARLRRLLHINQERSK